MYYGLRPDVLPQFPVTLSAEPSIVDAVWNPVPLTPAKPNEFTFVAASSQIEAVWKEIPIQVSGTTSSIFTAASSQVDAVFLTTPIATDLPTTVTLTAASSQVDGKWLDIPYVVEGATQTIMTAAASQVDAVWLAVSINPFGGSGAACVGGGSYMEATSFPVRSLTEFAISGWFQCSSAGTYPVTSKWNFIADIEWLVTISDTFIEFSIETNNGSIEAVQHTGPGGAGYTDNTWYFYYAERTAGKMALWVGTLTDQPTQVQKSIVGDTQVTSTPLLFGASRSGGNISSPTLEGRFDSHSFWQGTPNISVPDLWAVDSYGTLSAAQKVNLGAWWDFNEQDGGTPGTWIDSENIYDLTSVPPTGVQSCEGRPVVTPQAYIINAAASSMETVWKAQGYVISSTSDATLTAEASQIDAVWVPVALEGAGAVGAQLANAASIIDAQWVAQDLTIDSTGASTLTAAASIIDAVFSTNILTASQPTTFVLMQAASIVDAVWIPQGYTFGSLTADILPAGASVIQPHWVPVGYSIQGTTIDYINADSSQIEAGWLSPVINASGPTASTIGADSSSIEARWLNVGIATEGPPEVRMVAEPSIIDAVWIGNIQINPGFPAVCFTDSVFSYAARDISLKASAAGQPFQGFEASVNAGHLSVWTFNEILPTAPNAGFILSGAAGTGGVRLQMGLRRTGGGGVQAYFEADDGGTTPTAQADTADIPLLVGQWNHHLFTFDPTRTGENGGGWAYWLNGVEYAVTLVNTQTMDGKWFQQTQDVGDPNKLIQFLSATVNFNSGIPTDSWATCITQMVLRDVAGTQAFANYYYISPGRGTLISEMAFTPTTHDYAWEFNDSDSGFGHEEWGNGVFPRDTDDYFDISAPQPLSSGIEGRGNPAPPPA